MPESETFACSLGDGACEAVRGIADVELDIVIRVDGLYASDGS